MVGDYLVHHTNILAEDEQGAKVKRRENNLVHVNISFDEGQITRAIIDTVSILSVMS